MEKITNYVTAFGKHPVLEKDVWISSFYYFKNDEVNVVFTVCGNAFGENELFKTHSIKELKEFINTL